VRFDSFAGLTQAQINEIEERYLPKDQQRDYEHTFGHYGFPPA
jgi:hypothetical protein